MGSAVEVAVPLVVVAPVLVVILLVAHTGSDELAVVVVDVVVATSGAAGKERCGLRRQEGEKSRNYEITREL